MKRPPAVVTIDFETDAIERRPVYPPKPAGVSIIYPGKRPKYLAWGHPIENNTTVAAAKAELKEIERSGVDMVFHNAKFDVDVWQTHMGMGKINWRRIHDTLLLLFLHNPHSRDLGLKPSSEELLKLPPDEQDAVRDWLVENKLARANEKGWGAHICKAPAKLVGRYANGDTARTLGLFKMLYPLICEAGMEEAYDRERQLMPILLENERRGIRVNVPILEADIKNYQAAKLKVDRWLQKRLGDSELNIDSDRALAAALLKSGAVEELAKTPSGQDSVSKNNLTLDMFADKRVGLALGYRNRLGTCLGTFMEPWLLLAQSNNGFIHTNWNQVRQADTGGSFGTRTGRLSCSPNFQNIPKSFYDKGDGYVHPKHLTIPELPLIRRYVLPDDSKSLFCHRDYNQQELRIMAHFEDGALLKAYNENPRLDMHEFARQEIHRIYGVLLERPAVKTLNFGMMYGMGLGALAGKLDVDVKEAKRIKDAQRRAMPGLRDLEKSIQNTGRDGGAIRTWGGRQYYCEPSIIHNGRKITFEYKLLNYLIQGSAADCSKQAIINYDSIKKEGRFLVTVHDEINVSAHAKAAKREMALLREAMQSVKFDVPMLSDGKTGKDWGSLQKFKE